MLNDVVQNFNVGTVGGDSVLNVFVQKAQADSIARKYSNPAMKEEMMFDLISEYIDSHYFEELTVEKLAAMCNMSHSTFSMNFYRRYNMTCKEYITATRINAAENMLLFSSHDISFIAREVGYTDCSYFIRCYKKLKGVTPKQARKLQLGR